MTHKIVFACVFVAGLSIGAVLSIKPTTYPQASPPPLTAEQIEDNYIEKFPEVTPKAVAEVDVQAH